MSTVKLQRFFFINVETYWNDKNKVSNNWQIMIFLGGIAVQWNSSQNEIKLTSLSWGNGRSKYVQKEQGKINLFETSK